MWKYRQNEKKYITNTERKESQKKNKNKKQFIIKGLKTIFKNIVLILVCISNLFM